MKKCYKRSYVISTFSPPLLLKTQKNRRKRIRRKKKEEILFGEMCRKIAGEDVRTPRKIKEEKYIWKDSYTGKERISPLQLLLFEYSDQISILFLWHGPSMGFGRERWLRGCMDKRRNGSVRWVGIRGIFQG